MGQKIFNVFIFLAVCSLWIFQFINYSKEEVLPLPLEEVKEEIIIITQEFATEELGKSQLKDALEFYDIKFPDIVYAQAILETGHFESEVCKEYNNLFGLYDSRNKDFYKFNHWTDSIEGYKKYVEYKYKPPDCYYTFLEELPYAMDSLYIDKLKQIVKQNEDTSIR